MFSSAANEKFRALHADLRRIAGALMKDQRAVTLQPTVLVHEAYLRLMGNSEFAGLDRAQFLALAARVMRHVLIDYARRRQTGKRGGGAPAGITVDPGSVLPAREIEEYLLVDQLIDRLATLDPEAAQIAELRVFGGLTTSETAAALGLKPDRVRRIWTFARAWLLRGLEPAATS